MMLPDLPISATLPDLLATLARTRIAVLQAPPGAGKTTLVPLALLGSGQIAGRILMLEPRRLAARAAAERMAETLGERTGQTVGYRIRGETKTSARTRIEVVTEGILTRMLQSDPSLPGIGAVIFDEFHERSLNADLGLALTLETRDALRDDLCLLVMSATLDAAPVARMLNAPILTSQGRAFPVDTIWAQNPPPRTRIEDHVVPLILRALDETTGGLLVFLPGEGEIRRTAQRLSPNLPPGTTLRPLYGALPFAEQRAAIHPDSDHRKIVLATSIAETSLTIQDIRCVVDAGLARRARFDPGTGMSRLVTEKVTRAEADQRRGRAGRTAPGWCYRAWSEPAHGALAAFPEPEITAGDLTGLTLELAEWGADADQLAFLTPPAPGGMAAARDLLAALGCLDDGGRITGHGKQVAALPLHPRLAHMLALGGKGAARLAALLSDRDPLASAGSDLTARLRADWPKHLQAEASRLARMAGPDRGMTAAELAALAYPDRIGLRRPGGPARFILSGGRGAVLADDDPLARERLIVATDLDGAGTEARIRRAIPITEAELRGLFSDRIIWTETCHWSKRDRRIQARCREMLGALTLSDQIWQDAPAEALADAALDGFRDLGLPWTAAANRFRSRVMRLARAGHNLPDLSDSALTDGLDTWLLPHLTGQERSAADLSGVDILPALRALLDWDQMRLLDRLAPARFTAPTGRDVPVDYSGDSPEISIRLQELFGTTIHPIVAGEPLKITLLSPAGRPLQTTTDLPGFWSSSYADVRKDMRGRYPKHPWPEDPASAAATSRAKPRGT